MIDKDRTAREDPKYIVGSLIMCAAVDLSEHRKKHDPAYWPKWSDDTKAWWEEIEQRMTRPACLNFDWEAAKKEIREAVDHEDEFLKGSQDHMTSWRVGIREGLWKAYSIMEKYVKVKE